MHRSLLPLFLLFLLACSSPGEKEKEPSSDTYNRGVVADKAMVVCAHPEASAIGKDILQQGGNAVDASIAVQLALAVCYPAAGNIGGGGFMVVRFRDGKTDALDYREKAPARATRNMFLDEKGNVVEGMSTGTGLAVGVPGTVAGLKTAHKRYGKMNFAKLIQPAIELARNGFPITGQQADEFNKLDSIFAVRNPGSRYLRKEIPWAKGDVWRQEDLAVTLEKIRDEGSDGFYKGATAENIIKEVVRAGGIMSPEDLADYEAVWREPIEGKYKNYGIISMPPPSSGGIALLQMLAMLEGRDIRSLGFHSPDHLHLLAEVEKRAYADRATHLGDPDFWDVPVTQLLDTAYLSRRMDDFLPGATKPAEAVTAGDFAMHESEQTTHLSVVDAEGNAVSVTTTLNSSYGSKIFVNGSGFLLNNEMDDFSMKPGVPNSYGLVGGEANAVEAGKRMLSSMTPTIVTENGRLKMVVGTPGGSTIITSVLQTILNVVDFDMTMQEAVAAPRFHHQWLPDVIQVEEEKISAQVLHALEARGHTIIRRGPIGRVDAILVLPDGRLEGGADPRGDDKAEGF